MKGFKKINIFFIFLKNTRSVFNLSKLINILFCINLIPIIGCRNLNSSNEINICASSTFPCLFSTEHVLLITNKGKIKLELYGKSAPITVGNFIDFIQKGAYNNTSFNRVIKEPYPLIIRGGNNILIKGENRFIDKKTRKKRYIPLEIKLSSDKFPIYGKEILKVNQIKNLELKHKRASLSMARSKSLNSASAQFYILLKSLPELDGRFAVFGKVISGMNVVDSIEAEDFIIKAIRL